MNPNMHSGCMNCSQHQLWNQQNPEWQARNLNGSNMSLNLPPAGYYPQQYEMGIPPAGWINGYQPHDVYPMPVGMMPIYPNPGKKKLFLKKYCSIFLIKNFTTLGHRLPPSRSHSRLPSRAASPALSTRSRKSVMSLRNGHRHSYTEQHLTDDDSSDSDDYLDGFQAFKNSDRRENSKSLRSSRRSLKNSPHQSLDYDDDSETFATQSQKGSNRNSRGNSLARSLASRSDRRPRLNRLRSDSLQDSGSDTRALVQAKIREKVAQQSSMDESSSDFYKPKTDSAQPQTDTPAKIIKSKQQETVSNVPNVENKTKVSNGITKENEDQNTKTTSAITSSSTTTTTTPAATTTAAAADETADGPVGPPPKTPNYDWECEFCTFCNEANTKICAMCCKTPTKSPVRKGTSSKKETGSSDKNKGKSKKLTRKISFWPGTKK